MGKRQDNLLAKIAALVSESSGEEVSTEAVKDMRSLYTEEEAMLEAQSVESYYHWRKHLVREKGESDRAWEARQRIWQYKTCSECKNRFAYAYHYDGVKYCSLDCMVSGLKKLGIQFHPGRPMQKRYGYQKPSVVPSAALEAVESLLSAPSDYDEFEPSDDELSHPIHQQQ